MNGDGTWDGGVIAWVAFAHWQTEHSAAAALEGVAFILALFGCVVLHEFAMLAVRMDYTRATQLAANIGQGMAFLFGMLGLFFNPFLIFIALFVWIGAGQEAAMTQMKAALGGIPLERAMITDFRTLAPQDSLARAVELLLSGRSWPRGGEASIAPGARRAL